MLIWTLVSLDPTTAGPGRNVSLHPACAVGLRIASAPRILSATLAVPLGVFANMGNAAEHLTKCGTHCVYLIVEGATRVPDFQCN